MHLTVDYNALFGYEITYPTRRNTTQFFRHNIHVYDPMADAYTSNPNEPRSDRESDVLREHLGVGVLLMSIHRSPSEIDKQSSFQQQIV